MFRAGTAAASRISTRRVLIVLAIGMSGVAIAAGPMLVGPAHAARQTRRAGRKDGSRGGKILPKGTPYAAEVSMKVVGESTIKYDDESTTFGVCLDESSTSRELGTFKFEWEATFPHVTVPVATRATLGRAAKRLSIPVTATSKGKGGLRQGTFYIRGSAPATSGGQQGPGGSDCKPVHFSSEGSFKASKPYFGSINLGDLDTGRKNGIFILGDVIGSTPRTFKYPDGSNDYPVDELNTALSYLPKQGEITLKKRVGYNGFVETFLPSELAKLVREPVVGMPDMERSSSLDCSLPSSDQASDSCMVSLDTTFGGSLFKKFLYRTKRAYRK